MRIAIAFVLAAGCSFHPGPAPLGPGGDAGGGGGGGGGGGIDAMRPLDGPVDAARSGWQHRRQLAIANAGLGELDDFPLEVAIPAGTVTSPAGADLRFTDAGGTNLAFEIERWNPGQTSIVWVKVPVIAANATTLLWMDYDNPAAMDGQMPAAVWDDNFVGVWHLADAHDSTGHNSSSNAGGVSGTGEIGPAMAFAGDGHVDTGVTTHLANWTIEAWIDPSALPALTPDGTPILDGFPDYLMLWDCSQSTFCRTVLYNYQFNSQQQATHYATYGASPSTWSYVVGSYDGAALTAYLDSAQVSQATAPEAPLAASAATTIGSHQDSSGGFSGEIDEVRISKIARSKDYLAATYRAATGTYVSIGAEQPAP